MESQVSLGSDRRGCFEPPSETKEPTSDIECIDIVPIESTDNITYFENMEDESQIMHPDSMNHNRYVMGTRLQTRGKGGKSWSGNGGKSGTGAKIKEGLNSGFGGSGKEGRTDSKDDRNMTRKEDERPLEGAFPNLEVEERSESGPVKGGQGELMLERWERKVLLVEMWERKVLLVELIER